MKILQLLNRVPWPLKDGGAIAVYNTMKGLSGLNTEITVASLNTSKHFVANIPEELSSIAKWHTCYIDNKVKLTSAFFNLFTNDSYNVSRFYSKEFEMMLQKILAENEFDVIVCESIYMAIYAKSIRKYSKAMLVLRQHNVESDIWKTLYSNESNPLKKWYFGLLTQRLELFERSNLNIFDAIVPITEFDKKRFTEMGAIVPMFVSPVGFTLNNFKPLIIPDKIDKLYHLGSMEWMPNQEAMLWFLKNVWPEVSKLHSDLTFHLAGRGMPDSFSELQLPNLQVDGEVSDSKAYVSDKHIMIVPLFAGSGIRIKIIEAMAQGKVIVSTPLGAQGINGKSGQHFFIANDFQSFVDTITALVTQKGLAAKIGQQAHLYALEHFDNNKVSERLLTFYNTLISNK
jgi:glycosyltransferase involved in cell wall biosynthesis